MVYTAWTVLNNPKRPSWVLTEYHPVPTKTTKRKFAFLDDIRDFHLKGRKRFTRFKMDYNQLCCQLDRLIGSLDFAMPQVCVVPGKKMQLMVRDWSSVDSAVWASDMHDIWVAIDRLRVDLSASREPLFQKTYITNLPKSVMRSIVDLITPEDARNVAVMARAFRDMCSAKLDHYGKVSLRPSHPDLERRLLEVCRRSISAPRTTFGRELGALWAWFCERERNGRSCRTFDLHLVNRWSWAWNAYAEFKWIDMPLEVASWSTAFSRGMSSLRHVRDLRLDGLPLTIDALIAISQHPTLRGLHVSACGIPLQHEAPVLPSLRQIRRLVVSCNPASVFETASGVRLVDLTPNVVSLRLESRLVNGPLPLDVAAIWKRVPLRAVQDLTLRDLDGQSVSTILSSCLSRRIEKIRLRFHDTTALSDVDNILAKLLPCTPGLTSLVLDGIPHLPALWLAGLTAAFPDLADLGLLARPVTSTPRSAVTSEAIANALRGANCLKRFCADGTIRADEIATSLHSERASSVGDADRAGLSTDRSLSAAALHIATRVESLQEIAFAGQQASWVGVVCRGAGSPVLDITRVRDVEGRSDRWWHL